MDITHAQTAAKQAAHHKRILRIKEVIARTGLSRGGIYARMAGDEFPKSISLGNRAVGWVESEIQQWIDDRIAESRGMGEVVNG